MALILMPRNVCQATLILDMCFRKWLTGKASRLWHKATCDIIPVLILYLEMDANLLERS